MEDEYLSVRTSKDGRSHPGHWGKWEGAAHEETQAEDLPLRLPSVAATQGWVSCVGLAAVPGTMGAKKY